MAHRLEQLFPHITNLVFFDLNKFGSQAAQLTGQMMQGYQRTNNLLVQMDQFYRSAATDDDYIFMDSEKHRQDLPDERTQTLRYNTGLKTTDGRMIWADSVRNNRPERSLFYATRIFERYPQVTNGHRLLERYPSVDNLVFVDASNYIISNLQPYCQLNPGATVEQVTQTMNEAYRRASDSEIVFTRNGEPCEEGEADELRLPTGFTDATGAAVEMLCQRNTREGMQPWRKRGYTLRVLNSSHRFRAMYPILFGMDANCFAFMPASAAEGFNAVMRMKVDNVPNRMVEDFVSRMNSIYAMATDEDIILQDSDRQPVEKIEEAQYCIIRTPLRGDRKQISVMLTRNYVAGRQPWAGAKVISAGEVFPGVDPSAYLESFAIIPDFRRLLVDIAEKAAPEPWSFRGEGYYEILNSYIRYSAYRLIQDNSIVMDKARGVCVLNTGLLNRIFYEVCIIFRRDVTKPDEKWQYYKVDSITNIGQYAQFPRQPAPPHYWDETGELVYPIRYDKTVEEQTPQFDDEHIILERLHRLPKDFLENVAYRMDPTQKQRFLEIINSPGFGPNAPDWDEAIRIVRESDLLKDIRARIEYAVRDAIRRQRANYKTIIPCFYPRANEICFLLPLALSGVTSNNPAMVLASIDGGRTYYGKTILSMDMVYKHSRLICRPEADWIRFEEIKPVTGEADED